MRPVPLFSDSLSCTKSLKIEVVVEMDHGERGWKGGVGGGGGGNGKVAGRG